MAAPLAGFRLKRPLDNWSMREKLALASSVRRSGDQNWVSVSRAIKPFGETNRPPDWFSQKNCALQYADLLEKAETPKRKRGEKGEREVVETPVNQIVRKLTIERIEELKQLIQKEEQEYKKLTIEWIEELKQLIQKEEQEYKKLKREVEAIKAGRHDDHLDEMWNQIQKDKQIAEEKRQEEEKKLEEEAAERAKQIAAHKLQKVQRGSISSVSEVDESTQDSIPDTVNVETTDDESTNPPVALSIEIPTTQGVDAGKPTPPTSPLTRQQNFKLVQIERSCRRHLQSDEILQFHDIFWVYIIVGNDEIACHKQFLHFPKCFPKTFLVWESRVSLCSNGLKYKPPPKTPLLTK